MALRRLDVARFPCAFRRAFSHASAIRSETDNVIIAAVSDTGVVGYGEGCPRAYVTGETVAGARRFIASLAPEIAHAVRDVNALMAWTRGHAAEIDRNPSAFAAVELSLLDMMARERAVSVEALLGLPALAARDHRYSAVIGDGAPGESRRLWLRYRLAGFRDFKLKLSNDARRDRKRLAPFRMLSGHRLRLDANNLWRDAADCVAHLRAAGAGAFAVEEPLAAGDIAGFASVGQACDTAIVLDESFVSPAVLADLPRDARWIVNARVAKLGGLIRSLDAVRAARARGVGIVVGAHVGETGILTRAALPVAREAGKALVAQEGAFGTHLLARDLTKPSPRFGFGGRLPANRLPPPGAPGWGLEVDRSALAEMETHEVSP